MDKEEQFSIKEMITDEMWETFEIIGGAIPQETPLNVAVWGGLMIAAFGIATPNASDDDVFTNKAKAEFVFGKLVEMFRKARKQTEAN